MRAVIPSTFEPLRTSHQLAVAAFISRAQELTVAQWSAPIAPDKWSPAQIAEHLRLTYAVIGGELEGGPGIRIRVPPWMRLWFRIRYLPHIMRSGQLPAGARAPREARPGSGPFERPVTLAALAEAAAMFEDAMARRWDQPEAVLTHHVFGSMPVRKGIRFITVHTEHHTRQIQR